MSLKAFHVVFISAAVIMAMGIGVGCLKTWFGSDGSGNLLGGIGGLVAGIGLIAYEAWFLRKAKGLS